MPIYEYQCKNCRNVEEHLVSFSGNGPSKCKTCGGSLDRIMSRSFIVLKAGSSSTEQTEKLSRDHHENDHDHHHHDDDHHHH